MFIKTLGKHSLFRKVLVNQKEDANKVKMKELFRFLLLYNKCQEYKISTICLADPSEARGCSTNISVTHWFINWCIHSFSHPLVRIALRRRHAQTVEKGASSHKTKYIEFFFRDYKSWRASKSLYWFKSYGDFAEWVDFAYWWSGIGKGLPCSLHSRLLFQVIEKSN